MLTLYICLEGISLSMIILIILNANSYINVEASLKYFCLNCLASSFFLFSISLIFFVVGSLNVEQLKIQIFSLHNCLIFRNGNT